MKDCESYLIYNEVVAEPVGSGCAFVKEKGSLHPLTALPKGFCPALFHVIMPYFTTLSYAGWMRWVKKTKDVSRRMPIPKNASKIKQANRLFPNEILVQCPDPDNGVVVGIGPKDNQGKIFLIRIIDVKKSCPLHLNIGDTYEFDRENQVFCWEAFHKLYPYLFLGDPNFIPFKDKNGNCVIRCNCHTGKANFIIEAQNQVNKNINVECGSYDNLVISIKNLQNKCRYHHSLTKYTSNQLAPLQLCPDAFHAAYPFALALLYDADFSKREAKDSVTISCPNAGGIKVLIKRENRLPQFLIKIIKLLEKVFEFFFYPVDKICCDVSLTVVRNDGSCPRKHKVGEKYFLNIKDKKIMCPASFNTLFPQLVNMSYAIKSSKEEIRFLHCPDCQGAQYLLKNIN